MKKKLLYYCLLLSCLFSGVESAFATIRLVTTTELNDTDEGSLQYIWKNVADQDTIMFDESLKDAVITGATLATPRLADRYIAVIGNGVVLNLGLTINGGGYRLENLIVKGSLTSSNMDRPVYIKNCDFTTGGPLANVYHLTTFATLANKVVEVIVEGSSFTSKGKEATTRWGTAAGGDANVNRLTVHFISCTFESFQKVSNRSLLYLTSNTKGIKEITLTNCVLVNHQPGASVISGFNSATSYGYNVVKGTIDENVSWTAQETDIVDAEMNNPLVLH
ncbi:MAG: hypothetical protein LBF62_08250, partial [Tannerellaceae bacterium]|nr:hypothetical protein [Tannerellaceae bacterium]